MKSQLRQLMKIEREKTQQHRKFKSIQSRDVPDKIDPPPATILQGILKSKVSYSNAATALHDQQSTPQLNHNSATVIEKEAAVEVKENDLMKEFEDFLESVDENNNGDEEDGQYKNKNIQANDGYGGGISKFKTNPIHDERNGYGIEVADNDIGKNPNSAINEEELEQTVYEARLAKLMILSRKRKANVHEKSDIIFDYTPQLAFDESSMMFRGEINSGHSFAAEENEKVNINSSKLKTQKLEVTENSLKSLFKKKKQAKRLAKLSNNDDIEEDSYWSK